MGHFPSILKELNNADSVLHIGGVLSFMEPLCGKLSEDETDILGWVSSRGWSPGEEFCFECSEIYAKGLSWKSPSARE